MRVAQRGSAIADCLRESGSRTFRVTHFSIQGDHLHLVVEAGSKRSLSRGMQGLKIRMAKRLNRALGRPTGTIFGDRYHARALTTPTSVRVAIRYVLKNESQCTSFGTEFAGAVVLPRSKGSLWRLVSRSAQEPPVDRAAGLSTPWPFDFQLCDCLRMPEHAHA
jgi:REP element-mobilizing transposase RayT